MKVSRLVKKSQGGDKKALLKLITAQKADYYKLAYTYLGNEPDAMDAMSDMTVILYEKIGDLKKRDAFYAWSKTILVNCCKALLKNRKKLILMNDWVPKSEKDKHFDNQLRIEIEELLAILNEEQRDAIILKYLLDLDYASIADLTGVSIGTAKTRVHYGLKKLKDSEGRIGNG